MELKEGYKMTELGVIPEDWMIDQIKHHAIICTGGKNTQDKIDDGEYPFFVRSQTVERINSYSFDGEAVLTAGDGVGTGKIFHYIIGKFDVHQRVYLMSNFSEKLDGYFFYLVFSSTFLKRIMSMTAKSSVDSVRKDMIADMLIPIPSTLSEQTAIATALSDMDALITSLEQLIAKKRSIKQGVMQELLTGKRRLPGFSGEWKIFQIGDLSIKVGSGITPTGGERVYKKEGRPFIRSQNVGWGKLILDDIAYIDDETHNGFSATEILENDIFLNITGASIGRCTIADSRVLKGNVNQHVCIIRVNPSLVIPLYLSYFLLSTLGQNQILNFQAGGNRQGLNFGQIRSITISLPPTILEQQEIATILFDLDTEITALTQKLTKLQVLKQGMMQNLLTGKIRLI